MAAHRTTWGKPFNQLDRLRLNDAIVIETEQGWYTYRFRTLEYVTPDSVDVLDPVPQMPDAPAGGRYITLTACSPLYSLAERIVAYGGVFEGFQPRALGAPGLAEGGGLMYAALWRILPGPWWVRLLILLVLLAAVLYALMFWVFPLGESADLTR